MRDTATGAEFTVRARWVVNRTGGIHRRAPRARLRILQLPFLLRNTQATSVRIGRGARHVPEL
jgi:hypothetical protein